MNKQDKKEIMNLIKYKKMLGGRRMTNLEKWKKEKIEKIERMDIEDAFIEIWWNINEDECRWCEYKLDCEGGATKEACTKGIKAYLDMEVEE